MEPGPLKNQNNIPSESSIKPMTDIEKENKTRDLDQKVMEYFDDWVKLNKQVDILRSEWERLKMNAGTWDDYSQTMKSLFEKTKEIDKERDRLFKYLQDIFKEADHVGIELKVFSE